MTDKLPEDVLPQDVLPEDTLFNELAGILKEQERPEGEIALIRSAYEFARHYHDGQKRKSNENYIVHPVSVALILIDIPADTPTLAAAILHDVLEDTPATEDEVKSKFGEEVLHLVEGVTKLGKFEFSSTEDRQAENFRRMFLAMAEDVRVILLKLADRLHNMRTLHFMKPEKQLKKATETLEVFAPLANRLGMGKIRAELEDLSLKYLNPIEYEKIETEIAHVRSTWDEHLNVVMEKIKTQLEVLGVKPKVYGRFKNYYSIYRKMLTRQKQVDEIYDLSAVRIVVASEKECYEALGVVHHAFTPIPGRFKDYIAMPKSNLYQSLHTTVMGPQGRPLEVQIRTLEMHSIAEYGIAAHWKYKDAGGSTSAQSHEDQKLSWLKQMVEMKDDADDASEYVESVKLDLFRDEVFVFTPKGRVVVLPQGSTPIDFAYRIHTEVGHKCTGALVNGRLVPLDTALKNGDILEIMTGKKSNPRLDWIKFVQTHQAKNRIRQWHKKNFREEHEATGKQMLEAEFTRANFEEIVKSGKLLEITKELNYAALDDLYAALGCGEVNLPKITNRLKKLEVLSQQQAAPEPSISSTGEVFQPVPLKHPKKGGKKDEIIGLQGMLYHLAKCCSPVPGEGIIGVVTRSRGVMIHREDCINLGQANPDRVMELDWNAQTNGTDSSLLGHSVRLEIHVIDRMGVLKDILGQVADSHTNVTNAKVKMLEDQTALIELAVDVKNLEHLDRVKNAIRRIQDVISVTRPQFRTSKTGSEKLQDA